MTGGTGHLQQTAGLRSERECWGNFLSRQAGLRVILSTVDTPSATPPPGGSTGWGGEISLSFFFSPHFFFFIIYLFIPGQELGIWVWGKIGSNSVKSGQVPSFCEDKHMQNEKARFTKWYTLMIHKCCTTPAECMLPLTLAMRSSR